jgi:hypothetical protein
MGRGGDGDCILLSVQGVWLKVWEVDERGGSGFPLHTPVCLRATLLKNLIINSFYGREESGKKWIPC